MLDDHTHCACNGVLLCRTCHQWAHDHPHQARGCGFIVSRHTANPGGVIVRAYFGLVQMDCTGGFTYAKGAK